jgi:hypothetical protein
MDSVGGLWSFGYSFGDTDSSGVCAFETGRVVPVPFSLNPSMSTSVDTHSVLSGVQFPDNLAGKKKHYTVRDRRL